jgi:selenocysteine lyase/cysteine desulfurase
MTRLQTFLDAYPAYRSTEVLDRLRDSDFSRLQASGQVYLDFTGSGLHAASHVREHAELLNAEVLGNPHSASPSSMAMTRRVESARQAVLRYFKASDDYTAIFTLNASGALKLVGESFPFEAGGHLLLSTDNHNSVNGIREFARAKGAQTDYAPLTTPELRLDMAAMEQHLAQADRSKANLLAFPAQSNFSGVKHPLALIAAAHDKGWHVLLDAAAFVPTNRLDLSAVKPDFVSVSFYKMFGYPTGVGCLLVRKSALPLLQRPWFAGGTVNFATVQGRFHVLSPGEAAFEDGTLNFQNIPAVEMGLAMIERIGMDTIQTRVQCLTAWLLGELMGLRHSNGRAMVRLYGPVNSVMRGATVTLNFYDPDGHLMDYRRIEELAGEQGMSLRTGCFCNPGAGETAEALTPEDMQLAAAQDHMSLPAFVTLMQHHSGKSAGAVRVSLGPISNFADVAHFLSFVQALRDQTRLSLGQASFDIDSCRVIRDGS